MPTARAPAWTWMKTMKRFAKPPKMLVHCPETLQHVHVAAVASQPNAIRWTSAHQVCALLLYESSGGEGTACPSLLPIATSGWSYKESSGHVDRSRAGAGAQEMLSSMTVSAGAHASSQGHRGGAACQAAVCQDARQRGL